MHHAVAEKPAAAQEPGARLQGSAKDVPFQGRTRRRQAHAQVFGRGKRPGRGFGAGPRTTHVPTVSVERQPTALYAYSAATAATVAASEGLRTLSSGSSCVLGLRHGGRRLQQLADVVGTATGSCGDSAARQPTALENLGCGVPPSSLLLVRFSYLTPRHSHALIAPFHFLRSGFNARAQLRRALAQPAARSIRRQG